MRDVTVPVSEETVSYLQRLHYELDGLRVLHTHALNAGVAPEKRKEIQREYQEVFEEFQLAKQEFWAQFEKEYPNAQWRLDYASGLLHIGEVSHA